MKTICLYFEIHQNIQLKRYRFFDIGTDHYYYDDYEDERIIEDVTERSYMPALNAIGEMIKENGKYFKVAFSLSGVGMEQLEIHAPQVIEKLQELNQTGCVEFLAEPYSHGLASLANEESFTKEVKRQCQKMKEYFGQEPKVLRNSSLIYSDEIGLQASQMGFKGMLTEGARHVLGWKSPHYVYNCALAPNLKLLLRDVNLSDDISLRFSAEILDNCIKVDYWDIHALADAIYSICHNDSLFHYLQNEGKNEVDQITWEKVGARIKNLYERVLAGDL